MVSRNGHRIDLLDEDGKTEGISLASGDDKVSVTLDATKTKVTVHADGTVLIEGSKGIVVDSASSKLELKGGEVSIKATNGVTVDGGGGKVSVQAGSQLQLKGATTSLEGSARPRSRAARCAPSRRHWSRSTRGDGNACSSHGSGTRPAIRV